MGIFKRTLNGLVESNDDVVKVIKMLWFFSSIGIASMAFPATAKIINSGWAEGLTTMGVGLYLCGASTLVGGMIGFLFGVPRKNLAAEANNNRLAGRSYTPNTNLEHISDWLTKIIVGVGLT